jgi:excisionase family DNA binding protein
MLEKTRDIMTPDQAADYLQVNRETIYRYIRAGKLVASRLGKAYRIQKRSLDLLLWTTTTAPQVPTRNYTPEDLAGFIREDRLGEQEQRVANEFLENSGRASRRVAPRA